jgi:2-polyprenyl-3-methyl-5-hydroxy-6-metoxy-1,4-benzoquinol methylase
MSSRWNTGREARAAWAKSWQEVDVTLAHRDVFYYMDRIKQAYVRRLLPPGSRCLEVGCGSGRLSALLARDGHQLTCMDYTLEALHAAQRNFASAQLSGRFVQGDAFALPFAAGSFDAVFSTGLLEHFEDSLPVVAEMTRVLRPGGIFFSDIVPRKFSLLRAFEFMRPQRAVFERAFTRDEILEMLEHAGLKSAGTFPAGVFPPFWLPIIVRSATYRRAHGRVVRSLLPVLRRLDRSWLAEKLGFYWFCWGFKRP